MNASQYKPAGYCPHCGYAIDPGVCSECGMTVGADELHVSPYWITRRRRIKRAVVALVIVSLAFGGGYTCTRIDWLASSPARFLLLVQGDENSRSANELMRRMAAGQLPRPLADRMLRQATLLPAELTVRSPHPAGIRLQISASFETRLLTISNGYTFWYRTAASSPVVDGRQVAAVSGPTFSSTGSCGNGGMPSIGCGSLRLFVPGLAAGTHHIELPVAIALVPAQPDGADVRKAPAAAEITIILSKTIQVEDKPLEAYVRPVWTPELAGRIAAISYYLVEEVSYNNPGHGGAQESVEDWLILNRPPVSVAGHLWIRLPGGEWSRKGVVTHAKESGGRHGTFLGWPPWPDDLRAGMAAVDLSLVADPELALHAGFTGCFKGVIEWSHVRLGWRSAPMLWESRESPDPPDADYVKRASRATRVYEATASQPGE